VKETYNFNLKDQRSFSSFLNIFYIQFLENPNLLIIF